MLQEEEENQEKMEIKQNIKLEKPQQIQEIEIIRNYAKNCGFKECNTWNEINDCFAELQRKNNALMRDLHENSSWNTINAYDEEYENNNNIIFSYNPRKYKKKDLVPDKNYNSYYNTCD